MQRELSQWALISMPDVPIKGRELETMHTQGEHQVKRQREDSLRHAQT